MNRRFYFPLLAFALSLLAAVAFVVGRSTGTRAAGATSALAALPASDFVISVDAQRALNETLPAILAANPTALAKFNAELDEFQRKTGIDPRSLESIAIGGSFTPGNLHNDTRAVVIARGSFKSDEVLEGAFAAAKAKDAHLQREEQQYEGRRIFLIYSTRTSVDDVRDGKPIAEVEARAKVRSHAEKMAVTALDANTIAVGEVDGVRAAIDASLGRNRVDDELVRLASETPGAVVAFSGRVPQNAGVKVGDSEIEKYFASIRQFYGSFSADGADAQARLTLRTETAEQANDMAQAINTLKGLAAFGFAHSGGPAQEASLGDLLKSLSVTTLNNEVQLSVKIPQASFAPLVKHF
jgi:hypothetical protein